MTTPINMNDKNNFILLVEMMFKISKIRVSPSQNLIADISN